MHLDTKMALKHREASDCSVITLPKMDFWNNSDKTPEQKQHIIDRAQTLQAGIRMSYDDKIRHARKVIKQALNTEGVNWALSYSGGKDSTVLSHLMVEDMWIVDVPHIMSNTRMEYPETLKMIRSWYERLRPLGVSCSSVYPDIRPKDLWPKIGVPLWSKQISYKYRKFNASKSDKIPSYVPENLKEDFVKAKKLGLKITDKCCEYLKKKPLKKWQKDNNITGSFTGVRCSESRARRLAWILGGSLYQAKTHNNNWICNPLAFWTEDDVLRYLAENNLTVLSPDTPNGGSGCVTCMFGCQARAQEGTLNAMQDLKRRNRKIWKTALDDWGYRDVLDALNVPYE